MNAFEGKCGSCSILDPYRYNGSKHMCYCDHVEDYVSIYDSVKGCSCYNPVSSDDRDYRSMENRWYIVSEICNRLGLTHECAYVSKLFSFREDVLENDPKYELFLKDYDILGPFLASLIENDNDSQKVCENLFRLYLSKVACLIMDGKNDEALDAYTSMLATLKNIYGIETVRKNSSVMIKM